MSLRIPRVTVSARFDEGYALGDVSLLSVGYGLHQAWVFSMFSSMSEGASSFGTSPYLSNPENIHITLSFLVCIAVYSAYLLVAAATYRRLRKECISRRTLLIGSLLGCIGTIVLALAGPGGSLAGDIASGALTGLGTAMLVLFWGVAYARNDASSITLNTAFSLPIAMGVYAVLLHALPAPYSGLATAALPLLECAILWARYQTYYPEGRAVPTFNPLPINHAKFLVRFGAPTLIMGIALGALRQTTLQSILTAAEPNDQLILLLVSSFAAVVVLVSILAAHGKSDQWSRYFRPLVPFIVVMLLFLLIGKDRTNLLADVPPLVGYLCFEALMWTFFGVLAQRFRISPVLVFGLGRGLLGAGIMIGAPVSTLLSSWIDNSAMGWQILIVSVFAAIVVAYALLPHEKEIEAIVVPCPVVRAVSASLENDLVDLLAPRSSSDAAKSDAPSPKSEKEAKDGGTENPTGGDAAVAPVAAAAEESLDGDEAQSGAPNAKQPKEESKQRKPSAARRAMLSGTAAAHPASQSPQTATHRPRTKREAGSGMFRSACETVANTYLLSAREAEVMFFLAKGHNAAYIQEKLYISEGTAKTHIRHIYAKLDIHSQQELIRRVEQAIER